ncbi:MAG: insulinase family protein [Bacteroidetes bacterium]|nr:insulinase family protein [Bacteroidota bacterium]MBU1578151.1 insulinase family protein [Bacteroidota bacterium]MBU2556917.1 insulinase family protein [Bacteroidota bacterium]
MRAIQPDRRSAPSLIKTVALKLSEPQKLSLDNGIPLFVFGNAIHPAIRLDIVFDAGSIWQTKKLVASTTIKMLKEGTASFSGGTIASKVDYYGAYIDLQASKDTAWISLYCLQKHLPKLLPLLKSMLTEASFRTRDFKLKNKRQKQAFIINSQKPKQMARMAFNKLIFGADTAYGQAASEVDFDLLSNSDLIQYYQQQFHPDNAYMILSGAIGDSDIKLINNELGSVWREGGSKSMLPLDFDFQSGYHPVLREKALQSAIMIGRPLMLRQHPDYIPFLLLNTLLGGYFGSRLMTNIREDKGYTYGINSQVMPMRHATSFAISTETGTAVTQAALKEIQHELKRLREETVSSDELELVKNYLNGSYLRALDGVFNQAERFRSVYDSGMNMQFYKESLERIQATTADELKMLAIKYLDPASMVTVVVGDELQKPE